MDRLTSKEVGLAAAWAAKNQDISPEQIAKHLDITIITAEQLLHGHGYLGSDKSEKLAVFLGFENTNPISAMVQKWREAEQQRIGPFKKYSQSEIRHAFKNVIAARGLSAHEIGRIAKRNFQTLEEALGHIGYLRARYFPAMLERLGLSIDGLMQENNDIIKDQSAARSLQPAPEEVKVAVERQIASERKTRKVDDIHRDLAKSLRIAPGTLKAILYSRRHPRNFEKIHLQTLAEYCGYNSPESLAKAVRKESSAGKERG